MPALALFLIGGAKSIFGAVVGWLSRRSLVELACMALALFALVQHFQLVDARSDANRWHKQFTAEHKARLTDRASYEAAQKQAVEKNKAQVQRITTEQKAKTDAIQSRWDADRARLAELMRRKAAPGSPQSPKAGPVPDASGGPDGAGQVCIPEGDALSAAENELKLFYLQEWIREQLKVER